VTAFDALPDFEEPSYLADYEASLAEKQDARPTQPPTPLPPRLLTPLEWVSDVAPKAIVALLIYFASTHLFTGASKAGKTWWALQLLMAVAKGVPFLGLKTTKVIPLLVSLELSAGMVRSRMEQIADDAGIEMPIFGEEFHAVSPTAHYVPHLNLGTDLGATYLKDLIAQTEAKLVILDTLYRFLPGLDPSSNAEMGQVFGRLNEVAQSTGTALLLIDHVAKGEQLGPTSHSGIGAQVKGGASRVVIGLKRTSKTDGGRWSVDVESHFGSWDEPLHYERPLREDGTRGGGCVLCTATEAYGLSDEAIRDLFIQGELDNLGRRFFGSKRKLIEALIAAKHATGNNDGAEMVNAIIRDYCAPEDATGWGDDRPIVTRRMGDADNSPIRFTWRMRDDAAF
jgi:hypothetical protein